MFEWRQAVQVPQLGIECERDFAGVGLVYAEREQAAYGRGDMLGFGLACFPPGVDCGFHCGCFTIACGSEVTSRIEQAFPCQRKAGHSLGASWSRAACMYATF